MATRLYRFVADCVTTARNHIFGNAPILNSTPATEISSSRQSTRRTRKVTLPVTFTGSNIISGRISSKTPKPQRPCRKIEDYVFRLERLVSGINSLENVEELYDEREAQIADAMMPGNVDPSTNEHISSLIEAQDLAQALADERIEILKTDADALVQSLEPESPTDQPLRLPFYLTGQLKAYDRAKQIYESQKKATSNHQDDLDNITAALVHARVQQPQRGWQVTQNRISRLKARKAGILRRRRITGSCRQRMLKEIRKLCKQHALKTLHDENFVRVLHTC